MNLDEAQKQKITQWIEEGLKLSDIQSRISSELGIQLTYMEARFLMDDLGVKPKDKEPPPEPKTPTTPPAEAAEAATPGTAAGNVSVGVDQVTRPGALVSGKVTFSDGKQAEWYLDQMGRLGVVPKEEGYKPSQTDIMEFQAELQNQLARLGL